jgi:uncharacterized protein (DUF1330 family)
MTMTVYLIANVKVTDDSWLPDYAANVHHIVHKHGGEYLSRSANITTVEGDAPDASVIGIIKFPSMKAARGFIDDPDYAPYGKARRAGSTSQFYIIDDTDAAGTLPYLQKA